MEVLKIENRLRMFCYYNTLAWEILAAILASDIALATLPLVVTDGLRSTVLVLVFLPWLLLPIGGGCVVYHLRKLAAMWVSFSLQDCEDSSWKDASTSLRAMIDYVEIGNWGFTPPPRAYETYRNMVLSLAAVEIISALLSLTAASLLTCINVFVVCFAGFLAVLFALKRALRRVCQP